MVKTRKRNWPILLSQFLQGRAKSPFVWGENDCLMFAADAVREITAEDFDPAQEWRGTYSTHDEAAALLQANGGVAGIITKGLGVPSHKNILMAQRGDVAMVRSATGELAGGVVDDTGQFVVVPNAAGLGTQRIPLMNAIRVWSY